MNVGAICSAGGSAFFTAIDMAVREGVVTYEQIAIVTDRPCGAESRAAKRAIACERIEEKDRTEFSVRATEYFFNRNTDIILLFFSRLVSFELFNHLPTMNIHPSLLPAFPGLGALSKAASKNMPLVGATLHMTTSGIDDGPIISQVISPALDAQTGKDLQAVSFMHKSYLTLCAIDLINRGDLALDCQEGVFSLSDNLRVTPSAAPAIQSASTIARFTEFLSTRSEGEKVFVP